MKIVVLSSNFKVSLISAKVAPGTSFGAVWSRFWMRFGHFGPPRASLARPWALPWAPEGRQRPQKFVLVSLLTVFLGPQSFETIVSNSGGPDGTRFGAVVEAFGDHFEVLGRFGMPI